MDRDRKGIGVYADWVGLEGPHRIGTLYSEIVRGKEVLSFEYDDEWLHSAHVRELDPELRLYKGPQYLQDQEKTNFGLFLDSAPDRWGKLLMKRKEMAEAKKEGRKARTLHETDFLLGVDDRLRMGGLRFRTDPEGPFLNDDEEAPIPPWTSLRELEQSSWSLEAEEAMEDPSYLAHLKKLLAPGSSLGGARPKANVSDPKGNLWIAKFPSRKDDFDVGAWEMLVHDLAMRAGLRTSRARAESFSKRGHCFLTERFDRSEDLQRIHFASAMTLLGYKGGDDHEEGVSYLELAEFMMTRGAEVNRELEELWRRIVFNICVSNTDDHLRNHGFLLTNEGWVLSPAYDMNPDPEGWGLSLNIAEEENELNLDLAMEVHEFFRLKEDRARRITEEVRSAVQGWRDLADRYGIPRQEQAFMAKAFG